MFLDHQFPNTRGLHVSLNHVTLLLIKWYAQKIPGYNSLKELTEKCVKYFQNDGIKEGRIVLKEGINTLFKLWHAICCTLKYPLSS